MRATDYSAIDGKLRLADEHAQVLVIGAGPAGIAAAIEASRLGAKVILIDENPVEPALMALDAPLYYGGRMTAGVQHQGRVLEQMIAASPELEHAMELGIDVRLSTTAWGLYSNGESLRALPEQMIGLADAAHSWMCGFDKLIIATGARDIAFAFPGWDQPGVLGANGLRALLSRYDAFSGRRVLVLGSGALAMSVTQQALSHGLEVAAVVEVLDQPRGCSEEWATLAESNVPLLTGHTPRRAISDASGVAGLVLRRADGQEIEMACDTICVAIGLAPAIELLSAAGAVIVADSTRGGHVPALEGWATSIPNVFVVGDCAGLTNTQSEAAEQGIDAARQALRQTARVTPASSGDAWHYQSAWLRALIQDVDQSLVLCQCEEVTLADLVEVRAPKYLGPRTERSASRSLATLLEDGPANQDQIKRLTRACMGVCQARRCREQVALLLAQASGCTPAKVPLAGFRPPVRPIPLATMADPSESDSMTKRWEIWFGIQGQWAAYDDIGTEREFDTPFGGNRPCEDSTK